MRVQRILVPMSEVASKFSRVDLPCIDPEARPYFSDVLKQQRTGAITRQLAAWAAILAVPTAIAGIDGMNFDHMPELKTLYGYYVVLGVIAVICAALFVQFKRVKGL